MNADLIDGITLDFDKLESIIAVCRVAAMAGAGGGEAQSALRDSDLPEALYAARELSASLKARVGRLYDARRAPASADSARASDDSSHSINSAHSRLATIDGLAFRILEGCRTEDKETAALADALMCVAEKASEDLEAALELAAGPAVTQRESGK